jgi:hypothetical protein
MMINWLEDYANRIRHGEFCICKAETMCANVKGRSIRNYLDYVYKYLLLLKELISRWRTGIQARGISGCPELCHKTMRILS